MNNGIEGRWQGHGWAGIYWQYPENNWGDLPGYKMKGVKKLTFWVRGETGRERSEFKIGGIDSGKTYLDSIPVSSTGIVNLSRRWRKYTIDIPVENQKCVISGFCWITSFQSNPDGCTIYVDDIRFE